jgi:hypothetical protein
MARLEEAAEKGNSDALLGDTTGVSVRGYEDRSGPSPYTVFKCFYKGTKCAAKRYSEFEKLHKAVSLRVAVRPVSSDRVESPMDTTTLSYCLFVCLFCVLCLSSPFYLHVCVCVCVCVCVSFEHTLQAKTRAVPFSVRPAAKQVSVVLVPAFPEEVDKRTVWRYT